MSVSMCRCVPVLLYSLGAVLLLGHKVHFVRHFQRAADLIRLLRRQVRLSRRLS